jgi:uncharacterized Zn finger protein
MPNLDTTKLDAFIRHRWSAEPDRRVQDYVGTFFETILVGDKLVGKTVGNHGTYTVSIEFKDNVFVATCSCYIGKHGYCHHCHALALAFLQNPGTFTEVLPKQREEVKQVSDLQSYLQGMSLESLLLKLKERGISQKAFAEGIGMNTRHLSAIKSAEARNHYFNELGATKLACLWALENIAKFQKQ